MGTFKILIFLLIAIQLAIVYADGSSSENDIDSDTEEHVHGGVSAASDEVEVTPEVSEIDPGSASSASEPLKSEPKKPEHPLEDNDEAPSPNAVGVARADSYTVGGRRYTDINFKSLAVRYSRLRNLHKKFFGLKVVFVVNLTIPAEYIITQIIVYQLNKDPRTAATAQIIKGGRGTNVLLMKFKSTPLGGVKHNVLVYGRAANMRLNRPPRGLRKRVLGNDSGENEDEEEEEEEEYDPDAHIQFNDEPYEMDKDYVPPAPPAPEPKAEGPCEAEVTFGAKSTASSSSSSSPSKKLASKLGAMSMKGKKTCGAISQKLVKILSFKEHKVINYVHPLTKKGIELGAKNDGDAHPVDTIIRDGSFFFKKDVRYRGFPLDGIITRIEVIQLNKGPNGASVGITEGGVGHDSVTLRFKSERCLKIKFKIDIWSTK